jgi:cytosine/adenosine deaminase-related metal-dependent hydrolase
LLLRNVTIHGWPGWQSIRISGSRIILIAESIEAQEQEQVIELDGATVIPGFINSHDHLDFNCYPKLGNPIYPSYRKWGPDIHHHNEAEIIAVKKIPQQLRTNWGLYKNLLNGFTTVLHHGDPLNTDSSLVNVMQDQCSLHSTAFERNWKWKINSAGAEKFIVMHIGEGTDAESHNEINLVARWNLLRRNIVVVHGVAMKPEQAKHFAGLVWCPSSNYFLLGQTAAINELKSLVPIVFGMDSTLTSDWDAAVHFREALQNNSVSKSELLEMLTIAPARLWRLKDRGVIRENAFADLIVLKNIDPDPFDSANYQMILVNGKIQVMSASIGDGRILDSEYDQVIYKEQELLVRGRIAGLASDIRSHYTALTIPFKEMTLTEPYLINI